MFGFDIPINVIDFEGAPSYGVVEYGIATLFGGQITDTATRLCRAHAPIDPHDVAVHGITYEQSLAYASFDDEYELFADLRRKGPLAAHNARYEARLVKMSWALPGITPAWDKPLEPRADRDGDILVDENFQGGLFAECAAWGPWIDSCALARKLAPGLERYKLACVVESLGLTNELNAISIDRCPPDRCQYHCALYDAIASALILKKLICEGEGSLPAEKLFSVK